MISDAPPGDGVSPPGSLRRGLLVGALIILLPTVILAGAWRLGGVSALEDDLIYYLPVRQYIGQCIGSGQWPFWNPLVCMGTSVAADPQSGLWYPPTWLFVILPPLVAYPVTIILHFALAGGGMYRFLRSLGRHWQAALFGAIAFEFSGYLVAHRAHLTIFEAAAWLPLIFFAWQRYADTGRRRFFALAALALGLQMLVQHIQVTIITCTLLAGYVAIVLRPRRPGLWWQFPLGLAAGLLLSAVQWLPTWYHFAGSGRGSPSFSRFVENSWAPTSGLMILFPMLFGSRTPNLWAQPWWGLSHFCEQNAYGSIVILVLGAASLALVRGVSEPHERLASVRASAGELQRASHRPWNREILFWWLASLVVLILALGDATPLARLLFHVPIYRNLRVPARWILGWSVAMPVLASAVASAVIEGGQAVERAMGGVRLVVRRILPAAAILCLLLMFIAHWQVDRLAAIYGQRWNAAAVLDGLRTAIRPGNPAVWWPLVLMAATGYLLVRWVNRLHAHEFPLIFCLMVVDLASVAGFVDVDFHTYRRSDLQSAPPLAGAIWGLNAQPGERLLVPRYWADYSRPLEVLWPQTNVQHLIPTFNGYGPLWPLADRLMFGFAPWGSSEQILPLLRNPRLLQAMGVRFLAVRSKQERELLEAAMWPAVANGIKPLPDAVRMMPVRKGHDLLWPVEIDQPGVYELSLQAEPVPGSPSRWFVRLETIEGVQIENTRSLAPEDLAAGPRRMRFMFRCDQPVGTARVRLSAEMGCPLSAGQAAFGLVAKPSAALSFHTVPAPPASHPGQQPGPFLHRADLPGHISLYEVPGSTVLVYWAERTIPAATLSEAVAALLKPDARLSSPRHVVAEGLEPGIPLATRPSAFPTWERPTPRRLLIFTDGQEPGFLVFNESFDSGWSASIDGIPTRIHRVNAVMQGVVVPGGHHEIRWSYCPTGLTAGAALSLGTLLILVVGLARRQPVRNV